MSLSIPIIYCSVRQNRSGINAVKFLEQQIKELGHKPIIVDPSEYALPLLDKTYKEFEPGTAPESMQKVADIFAKADAFVVVSAEYNHAIPPALTNLMNHYFDEYAWKPSGIVTYSSGGFGGVRPLSQLRTFLAELGCSSIPHTMPIPKIKDAFDSSGKALDENYIRRSHKFLNHLFWYAEALRTQKEKGIPQ
ncbi:MAG: NADPH-dependent FMN reductase [Patescibacteria group bacterium]